MKLSAHISLLDLLARQGALDLGVQSPTPLPSDGVSLLTYWDGGNPVTLVNGKLAAEAYIDDINASTMKEYMVMRDTGTSTYAIYPNHSPRTPGANPADATVSGASSPFTSVSGFLAGVRSNLGLGSTEEATYARASARRFRVTNVSALAGSLTEETPASKKLTKLEGKDAQNNDVVGWVYVEKATLVGGDIIQYQIHQLVPASMILPPTGTVTLKAFTNSSDWNLVDWITESAAVGMQYCRGVCWVSIVATTSALQSASVPNGPGTPSGVEDWD